MSAQPNSREVAAITVVDSLTEELVKGSVSESIKQLRLQQITIEAIVAVLLEEHAEYRDEELSVFTSAVYRAARRLVGKEIADEIARENHHSLTDEQRANGGRHSGIEQRSVNGIEARGEHVWTIADDKALENAMRDCEPFHVDKGCAFWYDVAKIIERETGTVVTPKSCSSRAYKISKGVAAA